MKKTIRLDNGLIVTVVDADSVASDLTPEDAEMDYRAREAVAAAIHRAKVCKKPIARYDPKSKQVYVEMPNGERIYHITNRLVSTSLVQKGTPWHLKTN